MSTPYISPEDAEILQSLNAPFPAEVVSWRPGQVTKAKDKAMALAYIDARDVQDRLNAVCGPNWGVKSIITPNRVSAELTVTFPSGKVVTRADGVWAGNMELSRNDQGRVEKKEEDRITMEGKEAFSVALKRAAVHFGIGRYLYDLPSPWEPIDNFQKFTREGLERLRRIAEKPYRDWLHRMNEARRGRGEAPLEPVAMPWRQNMDQEPDGDGGPQNQGPQNEPTDTRRRDQGPPAQRPSQGQPQNPSQGQGRQGQSGQNQPSNGGQGQKKVDGFAPLDIDTLPDSEALRDLARKLEDQIRGPEDKDRISPLVNPWRETWQKGTPEYKAFYHVTMRARDRAGLSDRK